jgi:succinate-semialdehyde dehydrogenase/glutarate-semialdehyde dehydrogenase
MALNCSAEAIASPVEARSCSQRPSPNITPDNPAFLQEFFGPLALFFPARDEEAAMALANNSPFGLGGSVYTSDAEHGKRIASRIETGMVFVNYLSALQICRLAASNGRDMAKNFPISVSRSL